MPKSILEWVVGNWDEKRAYRQFMTRVNALPKDYRFAFRKMQHYMYHFDTGSCNGSMYLDLVELFESSAAAKKPVLDVIGSDVATFCDELIAASSTRTVTTRETLNREISEHFHREGA